MNKNYCIEPNCKKEINKNAKRCKSCAKKGKLHPMFGIHKIGKDATGFIDGRTSAKHYCIECKINEISYTNWLCGSKRCRECWIKFNKGKNHCGFKKIGTFRLTNSGYKYIKVSDKKWEYEHVYKVEKFIERKLKDKEIIHHIDGNKLNNKLSNLYIFKHNSFHFAFENLVREKIIDRFILKSNLKQIKNE